MRNCPEIDCELCLACGAAVVLAGKCVPADTAVADTVPSHLSGLPPLRMAATSAAMTGGGRDESHTAMLVCDEAIPDQKRSLREIASLRSQ
jgi:hypothetical protein